MKKYFCVSDIHSFYTPLKKALDKAGFDITNKNHILLVLGDIFDRGNETKELYDFLLSIPKSRKIMIKGNHEDLYLELLTKDFPESHDFHNGTVKTFCAIAGFDEEVLDFHYWYTQEIRDGRYKCSSKPYEYWQQIKKNVEMSPITKWLRSSEWKNYYEIDNYIFVHSFIPTKLKEEYGCSFFSSWPKSQLNDDWFCYDANWRNAIAYDWYEARWGCPWAQYIAGLFQPEEDQGKILVVGHWHASDFHKVFENKKNDYTTYIGEHLIGLDACTALTNFANVYVFEK